METVKILLSSYNGEQFLKEQIESIYRQKAVNISLLVRDDESTDSSRKIINSLSKKFNFEWYNGKNIGAAYSFQELLFDVKLDCDYYAFSDQDDIWKENKLITGITKMSQYKNEPCLYYSNYEIINNNFSILGTGKLKLYTLGDVILGQAPLGCTMIINRKLIELIRVRKSKYLRMHDHWCLLTCLAYNGKVIYDNEQLISYRQHSNNVVGAKPSLAIRFKRYLYSFFKGNNERLKQIKEFRDIHYKYIPSENLSLINKITNYQNSFNNKLKVICSSQLKTDSLFKNIIFVISIICNRF